MASFWDLVNEIKAETTGSVEIAVGGEPIPDGTTALSVVVEAKWQTAFERSDEFLSVQWEVLEPESLRGRKTFVKHWVKDLDTSAKTTEDAERKLKNAMRVFAGMDFNAGGRIVKHLSEKQAWPTIEQINMALANKPMLVHFKEWEMNGNRGNWISAAWPKGEKEVKVGGGMKPRASSAPVRQQAQTSSSDDWGRSSTSSRASNALDDEIPF